MLNTVWAVVRGGKIEPIENVPLTEGAKVLVTLLPQEDDSPFWLEASESSLAEIWNNDQDDSYAQLLEK